MIVLNGLNTFVLKDDIGSNHYDLKDYLVMAFIGLVVFGLIFCLVRAIKISLKERKKALEELLNDSEMAPLTEIDATVLKKECGVKTYGTKMPETRKEFYITFLTFTGETKRYAVSEELYLAVEEGTAGSIGIVEDKFFDFYFK